MEIIKGKTAGFCTGVKNAVGKTSQELENDTIYCLGELVHNSQVISDLEKRGLKTITELSEIPNSKGKKVIFRAHGVTKQIYTEAERLGLIIIDLTCSNVLAIHKIVERYTRNGVPIILIGAKQHPEVVGSVSFCDKNYHVVETEKELEYAIKNIKKMKPSQLLIISQTTFNIDKFEKYVKKIKQELEEKIEIHLKNTICNATKLRQEETKEIAKNVEYMIIIGDKKSSNTNKLYDIALKNCTNTIMINSTLELTQNIIKQIRKCDKIGIMAGASTPHEIITDVEKIIKIECETCVLGKEC